MCGLAGILAAHPGAAPSTDLIPKAWLDVLEAAIAHRGPDGRGRFRDHTLHRGHRVEVALVHRRLSILDHGGGAQPMLAALPGVTSPPGHARVLRGRPGEPADYTRAGGTDLLAVAFNGCIYNHQPLRRDLQAAGHVFASDHSDTEVLLHGTRAHGPRLPDRLDGMYAYAVWSNARGELTLARDPAGEKPLYFTRWSAEGVTFVAFANVPAALLALRRAAGVRTVPDPLGVALWLKHGYWPVMPVADLVEAAPGAAYVLNAESAWPPEPVARVTLHRQDPPNNLALGPSSLTPLLERAVTSRLDADVPIGCFLSGGVDSSIVAAFAHRALAAAGRRLLTFNVKVPDARLDESPFARMVAEHLGTEHIELDCKASAADDLTRLIAQLGLPFGDSSLLPTHWVSAAARRHVTVALGGDGGDELFAGYDRYRVNTLLYRLRAPLALARAAPDWLPGLGLGGNLGRVATAARHAGYDDILTILHTPQMHALLGHDIARPLLRRAYADRAPFADARLDDFGRYLPLDLMRKVDTASMAVALEVRAPFLDRGLVAAALATPLGAIYAGEGRKGLLRKVARTLVPPPAIDRRKAGFGIPMGRWFREDFAGLRTLLRDTLDRPGAFDAAGLSIRPAALRALMDEHFRGRRDHGQRLYTLLVTALWARSL